MRCSHHINLFEMCHYLYNVAFLAFFGGGKIWHKKQYWDYPTQTMSTIEQTF